MDPVVPIVRGQREGHEIVRHPSAWGARAMRTIFTTRTSWQNHGALMVMTIVSRGRHGFEKVTKRRTPPVGHVGEELRYNVSGNQTRLGTGQWHATVLNVQGRVIGPKARRGVDGGRHVVAQDCVGSHVRGRGTRRHAKVRIWVARGRPPHYRALSQVGTV
jgi:hypothetical protein